MKAVGQRSLRPESSPPTHTRWPASNCGAHERQANLVAQRFLRGDTGLARLITPAPTAGFHLAQSPGRPLPDGVRRQLETAFGANLGDVRIHHDDYAATATRAFGAQAFTSGVHVYFGEGRFRAHNATDRGLLVHEIAHVLQQTGRAASGGRLASTSVVGAGDVQRVPIPEFAKLRPAHAPGPTSKNRKKYDEVADVLQTLVDGPQAADAVQAFATTTALPRIKLEKWPHQAESLLYDTLKHFEKFDVAAQLLERDDLLGGNRINTIGFSPGLTDALEKRNGGWAVYVKALSNVTWLKKYEAEWLRKFDVFLFQSMESPNVAPLLPSTRSEAASAETIFDHAKALFDELSENKTVSSNEWVYLALLLLSDLDQARYKKCIAIWNETINRGDLSRVKQARAEGVVALGKSFADAFDEFGTLTKFPDAAGIKKSLTPYLTGLGRKVAVTAEAALAVWGEAKSLTSLMGVSEETAPSDEKVSARQVEARRVAANKLALGAALPAVLARFLREINRATDRGDRAMASVDYRDRVKPLEQKLTAFWLEQLEAPQTALFTEKKADQLLALIALSLWFRNFLGLVRWTLVESPTRGERPPVSTPDAVRFYRIRLARQVRWVADALGWRDAVASADEILEAKLETESVLAILPYDDGDLWKLDHEGERNLVERAREDFGDTVIHGMSPLSMVMIAQFYTAMFYDELAAQIRQRLPRSDAEEKRLVETGGQTPYLVSGAYSATKVDLPRRWSTHEAEFARNARDKRDFLDMIAAHPSFQELKGAQLQPGHEAILPLKPSLVFVWFIPSYDRLIEAMKRQPLLTSLVAGTFTSEKVATKRVDLALRLEPRLWFDRLQEALKDKVKDKAWVQTQWALVYKAAADMSAGILSTARTALLTDWKRAMRRDRQLIAKMVLADLESFADDHHDTSSIFRALKSIRHFYAINATLEDDDQNQQLAALLLEVAPALESALEYEQRFGIVFPFLGIMEQALEAAQTIKPLPPAERGLLLPPHEDRDAWINAQINHLESITKTLQAVRGSAQKREGFSADKDKKEIDGLVKYSSPLPVGTIMHPRYGGFLGQPSRNAYRVSEVLRSFIYHPAYGGGAGSGASQGLKSGYQATQLLELDDKTSLSAAATDPLLKVEVLLPQNGTWVVDQTLMLTPGDTDRMYDLYNGVLWASFGSSMSNINAGIEQILEFYLDVAELLPGVGPAIAAARISAAICQFLKSADYKALVELIGGNLKKVVEGLWNSIENNLDPENLLLLVLFGDPRLDYLLAHSTLGAGGKNSPLTGGEGDGKVGTLQKTIDAFRRLGHAVFKALRKLQTSVERPMQDVRSFASTRPLLAFALHYTADHIFQILKLVETIQSIAARLEEKGAQRDLVESVKKEVKLQQSGFGERLAGILHALEELRLPETVIDITPAVSKVFSFAESTIIKKTGLYGKVVSLALKHSGAYDFLNDQIARAIVEHGADPNLYWRDEIVPKIEGRFNETRDALVRQVNQILASPTFKEVFETMPSVGTMKVATDPGEHFDDTLETYVPTAGEAKAAEPDTAPDPSADRPLRMQPAIVPAFGPGTRLSVDLRSDFERRLGSDLGHVRLHSGSTAEAMTGAFGADALTSGSHVFLRPGRSPDRDRVLLGHELVHVVQQTGRRPLGHRHPDMPVVGHPARGLNWDPAREAQADEVARAMKPASASVPLAATTGLQGSGIGWFTIARMMREMSNLPEVKARAEAIDKEAKGKAPPKEVADVVNTVLSTLATKTLDATIVKPLKPFESVMQLVQNRLTDTTFADPIRKAAKEIAFEALVPSVAPPGSKQHLAPGHFERQLEGYILDRTGLAFVFDLNTTKTTEDGKEYDIVHPNNPVKLIKLAHIHLPYMDGRAPFWGQAIDNTWPSPAHTPEYRTRMRRVLRPLLESRGIAPGIWPMFGGGYRFSLWFKGDAEKEEKQLGAATPSPVPDWTDYVKTEKDLPDKIGLRLAHYDHASQIGAAGRQSHHLTQYLLADFFSNTNDTRAFVAPRNYPGVTFRDGQVLTIAAKEKVAAKEETIDVEATKGNGRGSDMPTISLAAVTHQKGNLHVTPEADDVGGGTKRSQGNALRNEFTRQLPAALAAVDANTYKSYFSDHSRDDAAAAIYRATQATYAAVEHHMSTQLKKNMPQLEYDYYLGLVEGTSQDIRDQTRPDVKTEAQRKLLAALEKIPGEAKQHNEKEMREKFGWKAKR